MAALILGGKPDRPGQNSKETTFEISHLSGEDELLVVCCMLLLLVVVVPVLVIVVVAKLANLDTI